MEVIQDNIVMIGGAVALLVVLLIVFVIIRKKKKKKVDGQSESVMSANESSADSNEVEENIEINESEEEEYIPEKELVSLRKVSKGRNFFSIHLNPLEDSLHVISVEPSSNSYGEIFKLADLTSKEYHRRKPLSIHFDYNKRGLRNNDLSFEMTLSYRDRDSTRWNQRFIFDKSGECRLLKPRRA